MASHIGNTEEVNNNDYNNEAGHCATVWPMVISPTSGLGLAGVSLENYWFPATVLLHPVNCDKYY